MFGTDGIRGIVDSTIDTRLAYSIGKAIAIYINKYNLRREIIIGCDTRISASALVYAFSVGVVDYGVDVNVVGIIPTAGISYLSRIYDCIGIMITASHNSSEYNGIKCFDSDGYKFSKDIEKQIEKLSKKKYAKTLDKGIIKFSQTLKKQYHNYLKSTFYDLDYDGNIAFDVANGVNFDIASSILKPLDLNYKIYNTSNDGHYINKDCGATCMKTLLSYKGSYDYDIGFSFDGDADRLRVVDVDGNILSGDEIIYIFAMYLKKQNKLYRNTVVGTLITSKSLEISLNNIGIDLVRVDVGDRNVIECMKQNGYELGGEESGHICILDYNTSCDALFNALFLLKVLGYYGKSLSKLLSKYVHIDRYTENIEISESLREEYLSKSSLYNKVQQYISLHTDFSIIVRPSGTENVLRVVIEGKKSGFSKIIKDIRSFIKENKE